MKDLYNLEDIDVFKVEPIGGKDFGFVLTESGEVVDFRGMDSGETPLVWRDGAWVPFSDGTFDDIMSGLALTEAKAASLTSGGTSL
jgi:hypothetical protein